MALPSIAPPTVANGLYLSVLCGLCSLTHSALSVPMAKAMRDTNTR